LDIFRLCYGVRKGGGDWEKWVWRIWWVDIENRVYIKIRHIKKGLKSYKNESSTVSRR
jgi:hypothetical protein